jgi:hypothetical protein
MEVNDSYLDSHYANRGAISCSDGGVIGLLRLVILFPAFVFLSQKLSYLMCIIHCER